MLIIHHEVRHEVLDITSSDRGRFSQLFHVILSMKSALKWSLNAPPHLKRVATLLCEMLMTDS